MVKLSLEIMGDVGDENISLRECIEVVYADMFGLCLAADVFLKLGTKHAKTLSELLGEGVPLLSLILSLTLALGESFSEYMQGH